MFGKLMSRLFGRTEKHPVRRLRFRPCLEQLETRLVPAAKTYTWIGADGASWDVGANWSTNDGTVPDDSSDIAVFNHNNTDNGPALASSKTIGQIESTNGWSGVVQVKRWVLTIDRGSTPQDAGDSNWRTGTISIGETGQTTGRLTEAGGTFNFHGGSITAVTSSAEVWINYAHGSECVLLVTEDGQTIEPSIYVKDASILRLNGANAAKNLTVSHTLTINLGGKLELFQGTNGDTRGGIRGQQTLDNYGTIERNGAGADNLVDMDVNTYTGGLVEVDALYGLTFHEYVQYGGTTKVHRGTTLESLGDISIQGGDFLVYDDNSASTTVNVVVSGTFTFAGGDFWMSYDTHTQYQTLVVTGDFTFNFGTLYCYCDGTTMGNNYDKITVSGTCTLSGGTFNLTRNGMSPLSTWVCDFISASSLSGDFTTKLPSTWTFSNTGGKFSGHKT